MSIQELTDKAEQSQKTAEQLKSQQDYVAKAAAGGNPTDIDKVLQERVNQLQSRNEALQNSLDTAGRESGRLKLELDQAIKERDAFKRMSVKDGPAVVSGPKPGTLDTNHDGLQYVWIPPGEFQMGCSAGDEECRSNEHPSQSVKISKGLWMGQTEVTQAAYEQMMRKSPIRVRGPQFPVESVTFREAAEYCRAVAGRLPTEAEWEYAARAGSPASRYGKLDAIAWFRENSGNTAHPVKLKQPNAWGLYDMLGNVPEWVSTFYHASDYGTQQSGTDYGTAPGGIYYLVSRGGGHSSDPRAVRASVRFGVHPENRNANVGFRCVVEIIPP